jgi:outer membrane receptor protein involved in Fe transport
MARIGNAEIPNVPQRFEGYRMALLTRVFVALVLSLAAWPASAQMTTGSISGRITDAQGGAMPGVSIEARNRDTGFIREDVSDEAGTYHLSALPVGSYDISANISGFRRHEAPAVPVNIGREVAHDIELQVGPLTETVTVSAPAVPASPRSSSVGEVVDLARIEALPLNGRQFANLAATVPGVGLGFHSDSTKSTQYSPQIGGGNGRNVNYIVDGGDNNDDTVGGLLQLYPLEAIQEFDVITHRFDAEYGRSNGAVLNVVTKSGTNQLRGSWFTLVRNDALNARTLTERIQRIPKQDYDRLQFGGSVGGPVVRNQVHYFAAYERTQQDTKQAVDTLGLFPAQDGIFDVPLRQNLFTAKVTATLQADHYLALRYGSDRNSQPAGAGLRAAHSSWATSTNTFNSVNLNHNWVVGAAALNELVVQYAGFVNDIAGGSAGPALRFVGGVSAGASLVAPQRTEQTKWQVRNDVTRIVTGLGLSHELKGGVNWIHEPRLRAYSGTFLEGFYQIGTLSLTGPVIQAVFIGGNTAANIPIDLFGVYAQDTWRATDRLTLNLGVRWDYVDGMPIDQSGMANFEALQAAGRTGRFAGTILEDFGQDTRSDRDNVQPRLGAVFDLSGDGRDIIRGGWGVYADFGYTSSNVLFAALDLAGGGQVFSALDPAGLRKLDGTLFTIADPIASIAHLNTIRGGSPPGGEVTSPLLEQPYSIQSNLGWAHRLSQSMMVSADYVRVDGRDLNMRVRPNVLINGQRFLAGVGVQPNNQAFRTALSKGSSRYDGLILALRRRMSAGVDFTASYTIARATSDVGTASDEIAQNWIEDIRDPFSDVQQGPSGRTDARHNVSLTAIVRAPFGVDVAPIFFYRSALPIHTIEGIDRNADGLVNERTSVAYRFTGLDEDAGVATFEADGPCETVVCSRRAPFSQLNLRISRAVPIRGRARIEAIAEVFNLLNAKNPALPLSQTRITNNIPNSQFMQPAGYAGDVGQPEQRVGQVGFRLTF